jgi:hypothetical protein
MTVTVSIPVIAEMMDTTSSDTVQEVDAPLDAISVIQEGAP